MKATILSLVTLMALSAMPQDLSAQKADKKDPVVFNIGGRDVKASEFEYFYNKNNQLETLEDKSFDEYVDLFINYRLKVSEGYAQGVDTTKAYIDELAGYRKQLAEPYLTMAGWGDTLVNQAYERRKWEVKASHLLLTCDKETPKQVVDSLYNVVLGYQHEVEAGASFDSLARNFSQDPSARMNAGDLGYFSSLQMVYPFEQACFNTPVGETTIVRSSFGWHLIKVYDKRRAEGEVMVAHIMKVNPRFMEDNAASPKQQIDSIYQVLKNGADFAEVCMATSDDQGTAANGGVYNWISRQSRFPQEWLDAAFALKEKDEMTAPFETLYGWHILKLVDKRTETPRDSANDERLKQQLMQDEDRMKAGQDAFLAQKRQELMQDKKLAKTVAQWSDEGLLNWLDKNLEDREPDFRNIYREYHDGLMLFEVSNKAVWEKAQLDSIGQEKFFEENRAKYAYEQPKFKGAFVECVDDSLLYNALTKIYENNDALAAADLVRSTILTDSILTPNPQAPRFHIVNGIFSHGDNDLVDVEQFHIEGATFTARERMPLAKTYGRVITAPESVNDVRGAVIGDYQMELEKEWVAQLKEKFKVKVNKKELEKLRK